jgi:hypothetical protein
VLFAFGDGHASQRGRFPISTFDGCIASKTCSVAAEAQLAKHPTAPADASHDEPRRPAFGAPYAEPSGSPMASPRAPSSGTRASATSRAEAAARALGHALEPRASRDDCTCPRAFLSPRIFTAFFPPTPRKRRETRNEHLNPPPRDRETASSVATVSLPLLAFDAPVDIAHERVGRHEAHRAEHEPEAKARHSHVPCAAHTTEGACADTFVCDFRAARDCMVHILVEALSALRTIDLDPRPSTPDPRPQTLDADAPKKKDVCMKPRMRALNLK